MVVLRAERSGDGQVLDRLVQLAHPHVRQPQPEVGVVVGGALVDVRGESRSRVGVASSGPFNATSDGLEMTPLTARSDSSVG